MRIRPEPDWARAREAMVRDQIAARGVSDPRVLAALRRVPRHLFVPGDRRGAAYEDRPLPIADGQTISQPYVVALMSELAVGPGTRRALDVGTGSGYQAAVLAELVPSVDSLEVSAGLAAEARARLDALGYADVRVHRADGRLGWEAGAPYDAIVVACAAPRVPAALLEQLAPGGRLVAPVGAVEQRLCLFEKLPDGRLERSFEGWVAFVPMR